jgi:hypothetical protein
MSRRVLHRLSLLAVMIVVLSNIATALTATTQVSRSRAGIATRRVTPDDLKPAACAGIPITALASGRGAIRVGAANTLVLGGPGDDMIFGGDGADCIVAGGGINTCYASRGASVYIGCTQVLARPSAPVPLGGGSAGSVQAGAGFRARAGGGPAAPRVTTTTNYRGVEGLTREVYADERGTVESFSIPDWLMTAYGVNVTAVRDDLRRGFLRGCGRIVPLGVPAITCGPVVAHNTTTVTLGDGASTATTTDYQGVTGLTREVVSDGFGTVESFGVPDWLLTAYGGNVTAIQRDLRQGLLRGCNRVTPQAGAGQRCDVVPPSNVTTTYHGGATITTTTDYHGVAGLVLEAVTDDFGTFESLSIPDWLLAAYGGNRAAIEHDLARGLLHDRGADGGAAAAAAVTRPAASRAGCAPATEYQEAVTHTQTTVTRTINYHGVDGLIREIAATPAGSVESLSAPDWLLAAYGGNLAAIHDDLEHGRLRDRGRCP